MSYKENRATLVRREKNLMTHFIDAHKNGDNKAKAGITQEMQRNVAQRRALKRGS